jgi:hypothetical protein
MKISKSLLSKIIKEEIKKVIYEDHNNSERDLINLFVQYRNYISKNPTKDKNELPAFEAIIKQMLSGQEPEEIVQMLQGKIDRQLFSFIKDILLRDKNMKTQSDKLDNYEMSITPDEQNVYQVYNKQDPDSGFMRVPKNDEAYDQEDVRKNRKTLSLS